jgi:hypothetical protein
VQKGENPMIIKDLPVGILAVFNLVELSGNSISKDGRSLPSFPVFSVGGAEKAVNKVQPSRRNRQIEEDPVSHLNPIVGICLRWTRIASPHRRMQALLNTICLAGQIFDYPAATA